MSQPVTFKSRIDTWVLVSILLLISIAVLAIDAVLGIDAAWRWLLVAVIAVAGGLLPLWILTFTRYELGDQELKVRCGPFTWVVPIHQISAVSRTKSAARGPALSTSRLRVDYGNGQSVLISPDNRDIFVRSLEARRADTAGRAPGS